MSNEFPNGLTVKELKNLIGSWPETDASGDDAEVWIETGRGLSNQVRLVNRLNQVDMILEPSPKVWEE